LNFAVEEEGLAVRAQPRSQEEIVLPMHDTVRIPLPAHPGVAAAMPPVETLIFARIAIYWAAWVEAWQREQRSESPRLLPMGLALTPVSHPPGAVAERLAPPPPARVGTLPQVQPANGPILG